MSTKPPEPDKTDTIETRRENGHSLLTVRAGGNISSRRAEQAALRDFKESGVSEQPATAPTLQVLLDYCAENRKSFTLHWDGATGTWGLYGERRKRKRRVLWKQEPGATVHDPVLLIAEIGYFRALLSRNQEGWRLQITGSSQSWPLGPVDLIEAQSKAARILRETFTRALDTTTQEA